MTEAIADILARQIAEIDDVSHRDWLDSRLVRPRKIELLWEYGESNPIRAWIVAEVGERKVEIAYCEGGHGALGYPWGLVFSGQKYFGSNDSWYPDLKALLADCGYIPDY
ncbi:hypothetical protein V0U79_07865 [Hyphobacterium sp. HN65]|uniref:Phage protein n=1 Tax=Hyphobacterium lacteum TaxID=3116575 RepID=A0ABU7LQT2_9PROT|nr:hypothetical protein [Hyphobacterium sp. HN65]MEE2526280.1 hypothetical protein [Hyphobacterium sp. HN65]